MDAPDTSAQSSAASGSTPVAPLAGVDSVAAPGAVQAGVAQLHALARPKHAFEEAGTME